MKVLTINGSPNIHGCTDRALMEIENTLKIQGIEIERVNIGNKNIRGCIGCRFCVEHGKCVFNDIVNETAPKLADANGVIIGSPVYFAGANGQLLSFLDRLFYSTMRTIDKTMKVGAAVLSSRRAGSTSAFDEINKYFTVTSMPIVSSTYWNEVHGYTAQDVEADAEGLQTMRNLARNMIFLLNAIDNQKAITSIPQKEWGVFTNFRSK